MDPGEQTTGTRDEHYNLVSVLYHALHGAENCDIYALDAEAAGSIELSDFFREAQAMQRQLADEAKGLLGIGGATPGAADVPAGGAILESDVPPDLAPEDVPPGTVPEDIPPAAGAPSDMAPPPPDDTAPPTDVVPPDETLPGDVPVTEDVPPETEPTDVPPPTGGVPSGTAPLPPDTVPPETPGGVPPDTTSLERDVPPGTEPIDVPPETDVQREAQVRADEVGVADEGIPPTTDVPRTPPDTAPPPEEDVVVEPEEPPVEEAPPRGVDTLAEAPPTPGSPRTEGAPITEEVPPSPSEPPPPAEGTPEVERSAGSREYFTDLIRETGRRSRGAV